MKTVKNFSVLAVLLMFTVSCMAKEIKTVVFKTSPEMHCANCEDRIKSNLRFEKGVKDIQTNLEDKTVTIKYDSDKTTVAQLIAGFRKIDYVATVYEGGTSATGENSLKSTGSCCEKPAEGLATVCFKAAQMGCGGCVAKVQNNMKNEAGVKKVVCDLPTKSVKIEYDPTVTNVDKLKEGFQKFEYAVTQYYPEENMAYVFFKANQMNCGGCARMVKEKIGAEPGVKEVTVCLSTKVVCIAYDSKISSVEKLVDGFKKFNYDVTECYN